MVRAHAQSWKNTNLTRYFSVELPIYNIKCILYNIYATSNAIKYTLYNVYMYYTIRICTTMKHTVTNNVSLNNLIYLVHSVLYLLCNTTLYTICNLYASHYTICNAYKIQYTFMCICKVAFYQGRKQNYQYGVIIDAGSSGSR